MRAKRQGRAVGPTVEAAKFDANRDAMVERVDRMLNQPAEAPAAGRCAPEFSRPSPRRNSIAAASGG